MSRGYSDEKGLTLLELIVAMFIMGLIMVILTASLRLAFRSVEKGDRAMDSLERMRASMHIINAQLQSTIPVSEKDDDESIFDDEDEDNDDKDDDDEDDETKNVFDELGGDEEPVRFEPISGDEKSITFTSALSIWGQSWGGVIVTYEIDQDENGKAFLRATEKNPYTEKTKETLLFDNLDELSFKFSYIDDIDMDNDTQWTETWDKEELVEDSRILQEVSLTIKQGRKEITYIIPVRTMKGKVNE
jgi:prepilin-type N-terminal cleavage/methylation domain-containing protein